MKYIMISKNLKGFVLIVFLNMACSGDHFNNKINYDELNFTPQLAVQSIYIMGEEKFNVFASKTQTNSLYNLDTISFETKLVDSEGIVIFDSSCVNCLSMSFNIDSSVIKKEKSYNLIVSSEGAETVNAIARPSEKPKISLVDFEKKEGDWININFEILDRKDVNEFYLIGGIQISSSSYNVNNDIYYPSGEIKSYFEPTFSDGVILPDISFVGQSLSFNYQSLSVPMTLDTYNFELIIQNWSQERYDYDKSARIVRIAENNPFAEPSSIHGNIEGGIGIFAIIQQDTIQARKIF